jgi:hypothetical protein
MSACTRLVACLRPTQGRAASISQKLLQLLELNVMHCPRLFRRVCVSSYLFSVELFFTMQMEAVSSSETAQLGGVTSQIIYKSKSVRKVYVTHAFQRLFNHFFTMMTALNHYSAHKMFTSLSTLELTKCCVGDEAPTLLTQDVIICCLLGAIAHLRGRS